MAVEWSFLLSGIILGLSGGLSPGPLLTLVISQTLIYGIKEGMKIALSPLLTDLPIIVASVGMLSLLTNMSHVIGAIYVAGGLFLAYLGYESLTVKGLELESVNIEHARSIQKGVITNFLNPAPYMFWITIGSPMILNAYQSNITSVIFFISGFYVFLTSSKLLVAIMTGKFRKFLSSKPYIFTIRFLGMLLFGYFIYFIYKGLETFGVIHHP